MTERVAVLGSARLGESDPAWAVGHELGRLLADAGFQVMTGGYGGLMAAVSRGAHEAGGHVIGLPMTAWTHLAPNEWNAELVWAEDYPQRLAEMLSCRAVVALDGGIGTLSELAVVWSARQTENGAPVLVAVGDRWRRILGDPFAQGGRAPGRPGLSGVFGRGRLGSRGGEGRWSRARTSGRG
jgi:uncharacterized protein (TIGR00725 family)